MNRREIDQAILQAFDGEPKTDLSAEAAAERDQLAQIKALMPTLEDGIPECQISEDRLRDAILMSGSKPVKPSLWKWSAPIAAAAALGAFAFLIGPRLAATPAADSGPSIVASEEPAVTTTGVFNVGAEGLDLLSEVSALPGAGAIAAEIPLQTEVPTVAISTPEATTSARRPSSKRRRGGSQPASRPAASAPAPASSVDDRTESAPLMLDASSTMSAKPEQPSESSARRRDSGMDEASAVGEERAALEAREADTIVITAAPGSAGGPGIAMEVSRSEDLVFGG